MSKLQDQKYLLSDQYRNASNLNARIQLHQRFSTNTYGWFRWVFAYILSTARKSLIAGGKLAELVKFIEQELAAHDAIHITKASGLFIAYRGED